MSGQMTKIDSYYAKNKNVWYGCGWWLWLWLVAAAAAGGYGCGWWLYLIMVALISADSWTQNPNHIRKLPKHRNQKTTPN